MSRNPDPFELLIRHMLVDRRLSLTELADACGVARQNLSAALAGRRGRRSYQLVDALADKLHCDADERFRLVWTAGLLGAEAAAAFAPGGAPDPDGERRARLVYEIMHGPRDRIDRVAEILRRELDDL